MRIFSWIAGFSLVGASLLTSTAQASAPCVPDPAASPHAFVGTVSSTERDGRLAHVDTIDGRAVIVVGSPSETGVTSVDRIYEVGVRYEFHPLTEESPFEDNACTRTRVLASASGTTPSERRPDDAVGRGSSLPVGVLAAVLVGGAALALTASFVVLRRSRRNH